GPPVGVMTEEEQRKREQDETLCRGYILSTLTDRLAGLRMFGSDAIKLDRMDGMNFTRWKEKMKFLLTAFKRTLLLDQIQKHLRIEEETRIREKNLNGASSFKKRKGTWNSSKENKKDKKPLSEVVCYKCGEKRYIKRYCKNPKKKNQNSNKKDESANAVEQVDTTEITAMVSELNIGMIQELHMAIVTTTDDWWKNLVSGFKLCKSEVKAVIESNKTVIAFCLGKTLPVSKLSCVLSQDFEDIQCADSYTRPPMLDRTNFASWQQRIRLYCRGKENGVNILKSIDEGPYQMGTVREPLAEGIEGTPQFGPERPRVYSDLSTEEKDRYNADIRATNILLQGLPKDIYTLINHYTDAKDIWDNVKMLLEGSELTQEDRESQLSGDESTGGGAVGYGGGQNRVRNVNLGQARPVKCYNCNGDLALNVDNVFQADDCDAFDSNMDEAPFAQTMFMANLSSADPVTDEARPSYDSNILSEIQNHDHYQDAVYAHHKEHAMHDSYVKNNDVPVVHNNVSSVPNDAFMMIYNDMCEPHAQSVPNPSRNTVVKNSLTAELATYKEQVELYERRVKFELTEQEQKINEQLRLVISDRNFKEETLKKEPHSIKLQLASTINHNKSMLEEVKFLKKDFNQKENKYLEDFLDMKSLKEKVEDRLIKQDQSLQTVHMLCRPKPYYNELNKVAISYKNPLCLTRAKQVQPALYNSHEIIKDNHAPAIVHNTEDTLEIAEITKKKMSLKEQTTVSRPIKALTVYPPNTPATLVPRVLPTKSQVKIHIFTRIQLFLEFDKTCKKRITPTGLTEGERGFEQTKECYLKEVIPFFKTLKDNFEGIQKALTKEIKEMKDVFEELEAEVAQNVVDRKHDAIERKNLLIANDNLIAECLSKEVFYVATNAELNTTKLTEQVTNLQAQNNLFRAENDKIKQHYKELYDSIKITSAMHIEQMTALTTKNVHLKAQTLEKVDSVSCSKHMTGDHSQLMNFVKKFIGIVRFGNDHFGAIMGYGDYVIGDSVISRSPCTDFLDWWMKVEVVRAALGRIQKLQEILKLQMVMLVEEEEEAADEVETQVAFLVTHDSFSSSCMLQPSLLRVFQSDHGSSNSLELHIAACDLYEICRSRFPTYVGEGSLSCQLMVSL
nr:integrase, catalytic region, zinc finger, CCHC-type, peptidase aspartic, catalytic [Tanacetum cinerariifolium]